MGTSKPQRVSPAWVRRVRARAVSTSSSQVRGGAACASSSMRALTKAMGVERLKGMATSGSRPPPAKVPCCVSAGTKGMACAPS